jgi:hypothetical protein
MIENKLIRAWISLLVLSMASTGVAVFIDRGATGGNPGHIAAISGAVILTLALIKARIILSRYLGLEATRFWRRGFNFALTVYALLLLGLYLAPAV